MQLTEQNAELAAVRVRKLALKRQRLEGIKRYGLAFYRPYNEQDAFHRAGATYKRRMFRGGNRTGKSTAGCTEDCAWLMGERPWYPVASPFRRGGIPNHPVKLLTITTDWDKVDEIFTSQRGEGGKVWRYLPKNFVKSVRRNHSGAIDTIECNNGSLWRFDTVKSFMANPQGSESSDWDAVHVDEPCPEQMFKATARGLIDRGGSAWFTLTPLSEFWINDYFFPQDTGGKARDDVFSVCAAIYDNPFLPSAAIKEFEALLTNDEKECRLKGIPLHLSGIIYKQFRWDRHVLQNVPSGWRSFSEPPDSYSVYYAIDPHPQTPHAVLFCAVAPTGQRFYFTDIFKHCSIEELCRDVRGVVGGKNVTAIRIDPLAYVNDPITETNMANEFWRCGVFVEKATKALAQGILKVQAELAKPNNIFFSPECRRTLWEIQRYAWDEKENKPIDKDDHMMENLYRLELMEPRFVDREAKYPEIPELSITRSDLGLQDMEFNEV